MQTPALTYPELKALDPCVGALRKNAKLFGGAKKWNGRKVTARAAVRAGVGFEDLLWAASAVALNEKDVERRLRMWMADCASHVLHIFEKERPNDTRPREAIKIARDYARGRTSAAAGAAAGAAARAAAWAAVRAAAWDAASAAARAAARDAASAAEEQWQFNRLVAWLSSPEPKVHPLPRAQS